MGYYKKQTALMKLGLKPIKRKDPRTYDFHKTFGTALSIPSEFNFDTSGFFPDQNKDGLPNACTAYAENDIASNDDKTYYDDQAFTYNNTKRMEGVEGDVPVDQMDALKAGTVYGVKSKIETPEQALTHRRSPYFIVKKNPDYFDGLISAMLVKQGGLSIGTPWLPEFESVGRDGSISPFEAPKDFTTGHCWEACGVKIINGEPRIICKSWQGASYGDHGYCYFNRKQINDLLSVKGAGAFGQKHASPEDIQKVEMNIIEVAIFYLRQWLEQLRKPSIAQTPISIPTVFMEPPHPQPEPVKYLWDNPENVRHSVRVICDELGLKLIEKNVITACVKCESGFKPDAVGRLNSNGTRDYGLCQYNNGKNSKGQAYWIGPGADFKDIDEVIHNPEKNIRIMIREYKKGNLHLWSSYSTDAYIKYL